MSERAAGGAPLSLVVLISGRGSNLEAIQRAIEAGELPAVIRAVISSRRDAAGLQFAQRKGIDILALEPGDYPDRSGYDRALAGLIDRFSPDVVVLTGFMRVLGPELVHHYRGRMINIHPSLLPELRGLDTHARALDAGATLHGASVHFVTEQLDGGPVIAQARVAVMPGDTPETLAARVLEQEHRLYPQALRWLAEGRIDWSDEQVRFDGAALVEPRLLTGPGEEA
jgi:phosphoribosylglycinamide formyltransferase-1